MLFLRCSKCSHYETFLLLLLFLRDSLAIPKSPPLFFTPLFMTIFLCGKTRKYDCYLQDGGNDELMSLSTSLLKTISTLPTPVAISTSVHYQLFSHILHLIATLHSARLNLFKTEKLMQVGKTHVRCYMHELFFFCYFIACLGSSSMHRITNYFIYLLGSQ